MILLLVDLLSLFNCPIAWGETIMKFPFIGLTVKVKRPRGECVCVCVRGGLGGVQEERLEGE